MFEQPDGSQMVPLRSLTSAGNPTAAGLRGVDGLLEDPLARLAPPTVVPRMDGSLNAVTGADSIQRARQAGLTHVPVRVHDAQREHVLADIDETLRSWGSFAEHPVADDYDRSRVKGLETARRLIDEGHGPDEIVAAAQLAGPLKGGLRIGVFQNETKPASRRVAPRDHDGGCGLFARAED